MIVHARAEENDAVGHQAEKTSTSRKGMGRSSMTVRVMFSGPATWTLRGGDVVFNGVAAHAVVMHGILEEFLAVVHHVILEAKLLLDRGTPRPSPGCSQPLG